MAKKTSTTLRVQNSVYQSLRSEEVQEAIASELYDQWLDWQDDWEEFPELLTDDCVNRDEFLADADRVISTIIKVLENQK